MAQHHCRVTAVVGRRGRRHGRNGAATAVPDAPACWLHCLPWLVTILPLLAPHRRYVSRKGPLVIYGNEAACARAFRNLPGVEVACVDRLNLLQLAPGGHLGRFCIWTKSAFEKLDAVFGECGTGRARRIAAGCCWRVAAGVPVLLQPTCLHAISCQAPLRRRASRRRVTSCRATS